MSADKTGLSFHPKFTASNHSGGKDGGDGGGWEPAPPADRPPQGVHQGRLEQGEYSLSYYCDYLGTRVK